MALRKNFDFYHAEPFFDIEPYFWFLNSHRINYFTDADVKLHQAMLDKLPLKDDFSEWLDDMNWHPQDCNFTWQALWAASTMEIKVALRLWIPQDDKALVFKLAWL